MIYPPDDLLNDLQSVVAPPSDPRQSTTSDSYSHLPELPGTGNQKQYDAFDVPPGYDAPALSDEENQVYLIIVRLKVIK